MMIVCHEVWCDALWGVARAQASPRARK